jgi:hypothetical protein
MKLATTPKGKILRSKLLTGYLFFSFLLALAITGWESFELAGAIALPALVSACAYILMRNSNINWSDLGITHKPNQSKFNHVRLGRRWPQRVVSRAHLFEKA